MSKCWQMPALKGFQPKKTTGFFLHPPIRADQGQALINLLKEIDAWP